MNTKANQISNLYRSFFKEMEIKNITDDEKVGYEYIMFFIENLTLFKTASKCQDRRSHSASILVNPFDLEEITRRASLLFDQLSLGYGFDVEHFHSVTESRKSTGIPDAYWGEIIEVKSYKTNSPLNQLGHWLTSCKELLINSNLFYLPALKYTEHTEGLDGQYLLNKQDDIFLLYDIIGSARMLTQFIQKSVQYKHQLMIILDQVQLPVIEGINLRMFSKIAQDEQRAFNKFRHFLREHFYQIEDVENTAHFERSLAKISVRMEMGLNSLTKDFNKLRSKKALNIAGVSIGTMKASMLAIRPGIFSETAPSIGNSSLLMDFQGIKDFLFRKRSIKDNELYYVWVLQRSTN